ncbi:hypothetical protein ACFC3Q_17040, partial [Streptomyces diastaticus]
MYVSYGKLRAWRRHAREGDPERAGGRGAGPGPPAVAARGDPGGASALGPAGGGLLPPPAGTLSRRLLVAVYG